jgi:carbon monoxide dehydrogenase subunit G
MTRIEIEKREIETTQENVFAFLSDFNNYKELMPESVSNWQSSLDHCSFKMQGLANIGMRIEERIPHSTIFVKSQGEGPFDFTLTIHMDNHGEGRCLAGMVFEADINPFMKMMVEKPLGSFFGYMTKQVQQKFDQP